MITHEFHNWDDFLTAMADETKPRWCNDSHSAKESFYGEKSFNAAFQLARYGWPKGREKMTDAIGIVSPQRGSFLATGRDVAGYYPLVPLAVAGDPACMVIPRPSMIASQPVVALDCDLCCAAYVHHTAIMNHGAAILSIVDKLEQRGYSCELRIVWQSSERYNDHHSTTFCTTAVFKRAGEPLDIDRAAFALVHPSSQRRFMFCSMEQDYRFKHFGAGFGYPISRPIPGSDAIYIPGPDDKDGDPDRARRRVEDKFASYLE
jgi:hypothetical protein